MNHIDISQRPFLERTPWAPWLALFLVSAILHFWRLAHPGEIAFDEVLIGGFASHYFTGTYYFDIHPPLLKLIYGGLASLGGMPPGFDFPKPEIPYPNHFFVWMRAFPALCGTVLPLLIARLAQQMGAKPLWALMAGWMALLDTTLLVESRFILNDVPLLTFCVGGWLAGAMWIRTDKTWTLLACGLALGAATVMKWTAFAFLVPVVAAMALGSTMSMRRTLIGLASMGALVAGTQLATYVVHLSLVPKTGPGASYMSPRFAGHLQGASASEVAAAGPGPALDMLDSISELNDTMARYAGQNSTHPYASKWFSWPFGWRGIYVWNDRHVGDPVKRIYLVPNLAVWWICAFAMARMLLNLIPQLAGALQTGSFKRVSRINLLLALAWAANFLPFALIERPMFIYHYFPALAVSMVVFAREASHIKKPMPWLALSAFLCVAVFIWMAPVAYGLPLSSTGFDERMLLKSWP